MQVLDAETIRAWDQFTIRHEPIRSIDLMERAARACSTWIQTHYPPPRSLVFFCGTGNNGGDGLAISRILKEAGYAARIFLLPGSKWSTDASINLQKVNACGLPVTVLKEDAPLPEVLPAELIVDALLGTGIKAPLTGWLAELVGHLNTMPSDIISIDLPSGLLPDSVTRPHICVEASHTLSFQCPKLAFFMPENEAFVGAWSVLDIGLHPAFEPRPTHLISFQETSDLRALWVPRSRFAHKGRFGHACLIGGSYGMAGAAVLAATACLRAGAGKLTCRAPSDLNHILQSAVPEAMFSADPHPRRLTRAFSTYSYSAVAVGPGIGRHPDTLPVLENALHCGLPLVLDADALYFIAKHPQLWNDVPTGAILTPHVGEFERMFGPCSNDFERFNHAAKMAKEREVYLILKGHHSSIHLPSGASIINSSGNSGMATAGSGDVLTGMILGHLAQGYSAEVSCRMAVFLHGLAGDLALENQSTESLIARDIIACIGTAVKQTLS